MLLLLLLLLIDSECLALAMVHPNSQHDSCVDVVGVDGNNWYHSLLVEVHAVRRTTWVESKAEEPSAIHPATEEAAHEVLHL